MKNNIENEKVNLKGFGKDIMKSVIVASILSIFASVGTVYAIYYKTTNDINNLIVNDSKQDKIIQEISTTVYHINDKLTSTNTVSAVSDEKIKGLEHQLKQVNDQVKIVQQTQLDMLKMLGEIKRK